LISHLLANDASQSEMEPFHVIHATGNPVRVAEVKLAQIPVQMSLADMLLVPA
jgi:hypothetical protein